MTKFIALPPNVSLILVSDEWYFVEYEKSHISQAFGSESIALNAWDNMDIVWIDVKDCKVNIFCD